MGRKTWRDYKKTAAAVCTSYGKDGIYLRVMRLTDERYSMDMNIDKDEAIRLQEVYARENKYKLVKRYETVQGEQQEMAVLQQILADTLSGELKVLIVQNRNFFMTTMSVTWVAYLVLKGVKFIYTPGLGQRGGLINEYAFHYLWPDITKEARDFYAAQRVALEEAVKEAQSRKLLRGRAAIRRKTGAKCEGRKGWKDYPDRKDEVLKRVRQLRKLPKGGDKRMAFEAIADTLNEEGLLSFTGLKWTGKGVTRFFADWNVAKGGTR